MSPSVCLTRKISLPITPYTSPSNQPSTTNLFCIMDPIYFTGGFWGLNRQVRWWVCEPHLQRDRACADWLSSYWLICWLWVSGNWLSDDSWWCDGWLLRVWRWRGWWRGWTCRHRGRRVGEGEPREADKRERRRGGERERELLDGRTVPPPLHHDVTSLNTSRQATSRLY